MEAIAFVASMKYQASALFTKMAYFDGSPKHIGAITKKQKKLLFSFNFR